MSDAFNQLNDEDQQAAIDVAISAVLVGLRIPTTGQQFYDYVTSEFAASRGLPSNVVKYALRNIGQNLLKQNWALTIVKDGERLTTKFTPEKPGGNSEGKVAGEGFEPPISTL